MNMAASYTPNINLAKPDRQDYVSVVSDINNNMDKIDGAFGTVNNNLGDAYDATSTYEINDICIYNNVLYKANTDISVPEAWNASHWDATTVADAMKHAIGDVSVDYPFTIQVSDWSNTSPYTYTWTNAAIVDKVGVEVDFVSGAENGDVPYIYYEKVTGGVQFTSPIKPTKVVPVVVHVINAEAESVTSITGDMVSTSVITGASNVDQALTSLNSNINNRIITTTGDKVTSIDSNSDLDNFKTGGVYVVRSDAIASTIAHIPRPASGRLIVIPEFSDNSSYVYQYYLPSTAANMVYSRKFVTSWSGWSQMANIKMMEETFTTTGSGNIQTGLFVDSTVILSAIVINRSDTMAIVSTWSGQGANASWGLNIRQCDASNQVVASTSVTVRIYYMEFLP